MSRNRPYLGLDRFGLVDNLKDYINFELQFPILVEKPRLISSGWTWRVRNASIYSVVCNGPN